MADFEKGAVKTSGEVCFKDWSLRLWQLMPLHLVSVLVIFVQICGIASIPTDLTQKLQRRYASKRR